MTKYYYNATTKESTYTRPVAVFGQQPAASAGASASSEPKKPKKEKKEKAKEKVPIGETGWQRVTTNEGHTFYFHKETKRSEWTVPDEIAGEVKKMDEEAERLKREEAEREKAKKEEERLARIREVERIRAEIAEERKRKAAEEEQAPAKKAKVEADEEKYAPEGEEDEEAWQRAVAAEFAEKDQKAKEDEAEAQEKLKEEEAEAAKKVFAVPKQVNVSLDEGRALFKVGLVLLSVLAIWHMMLWC